MTSPGIELKCPSCECHFVICRSCFRGHVYCSDQCRRIFQKIKQKEASQRYAKSEKGRKSHKYRQRRYRLGICHKKMIQKKSKTHETSVKRPDRLSISQTKKGVCVICNTLVEPIFRGINEYRLARRQC